MKKILFVHDSGRLGGAAKILFHLLNGLDRSRFSCSVVCGSEGPFVQSVAEIGVPVQVVDFFRPKAMGDRSGFWIPSRAALVSNVEEVMKSRARLRRFLKETTFDLVHSNGLVSNIVTSAAMLGDERPLVWHEHGIQPPGFRRLAYSALANLFADRMIAVSNAVAEVYRPYLIRKSKIRTVHNGLDPGLLGEGRQEVQLSLREELGLAECAQLTAIPSLLVPWKGQDVFIRAAAEVCRGNDRAHFLILGDVKSDMGKAYKSRLVDLTRKLGIADRVRFLGFRTDMARILGQSDLIVSASILPDPFPTIILEAMHFARPVVATRTGGQAEMVEEGETGLLVQPGQPSEMAAAISTVLSDAGRAKAMGEAGRRRVESRFTNQLFISKITALYEEVLGSR